DDLQHFLRGGTSKLLPNAFHCQGPNLTDFHPRPCGQPRGTELERQREACTLRLAGQGHDDHRARPFIEDIVAEDQDGPPSRLLTTARGVQVRPANLAPQYAGHVAASSDNPSSASAFSKAGSSFAHSRAKRLCSRRTSFSSMAIWMA